MQSHPLRHIACGAVITALTACGGSGSMSGFTPTMQSGTVPMIVSDASSDDWATIGVKVLSVALIPQGGGANVTVYTAPSAAPYVNLEQLDQLGEILGNVSVPVGTYTGAVVNVGGNPGDVMLTVAADPEVGFSLPPATVVASSDIEIQDTQGSSPNMTVPITVNFASPLVVTTGQNNALDLEFDLAHPAFIIGHTPPGATSTQWAVNFTGPVRRRPIADITRLVLRHTYGTVTGIASDNSAITVTKDFPALPVQTPETAVASSQSLTILADATNGTLFYDVDANTRTTIMNFSTEGNLMGRFVRIAARYQQNGTLVATRIWASSSFAGVWLSPEGHVLHANASTGMVTIENEAGVGVPMLVDANTQFYFRQPASAIADATPIGTGPSFLTSDNLVRGFKVHASVVDPLATPLVAQSIDIETAAYSGSISQASSTGFMYTHNFPRASDDYAVTLGYIAAGSANGDDAGGNAISGYKWWNFAFPTMVDSGSTAIADFVAATGGGVSFGGSAPMIRAAGVSYARWGDPANPTGWSAAATILLPVPVPFASVATGLSAAASGYAFTVTAANGTLPVTVDVANAAGQASLVYQVDFSKGVVTISPVDITTAAGLMTLTDALTVGTKVKIAGIAQSDGTLKAYVVTYFTNTTPTS